jgi:hypothetical protein
VAEPEVPRGARADKSLSIEARAPAWLLALGGFVMALIAVGLVYAVSIAVRNFHQIGV